MSTWTPIVEEEFCDDVELIEEVAALKAKRAKAILAKELAAAEFDKSKGAKAATSDALLPPRPRAFTTLPTSGVSQAAAKKFLPPGFGISKDGKENRWRIRGNLLEDDEKSKSYGKGTGLTDGAAMEFVISVAWRAHIRKHGGECPWQLELVGDGAVAAASSA